jgi:hypothetical protein
VTTTSSLPPSSSDPATVNSAVERPERAGPPITKPGPSSSRSTPIGASSSPPTPTSAHIGVAGRGPAGSASTSRIVIRAGSTSTRAGRWLRGTYTSRSRAAAAIRASAFTCAGPDGSRSSRASWVSTIESLRNARPGGIESGIFFVCSPARP